MPFGEPEVYKIQRVFVIIYPRQRDSITELRSGERNYACGIESRSNGSWHHGGLRNENCKRVNVTADDTMPS